MGFLLNKINDGSIIQINKISAKNQLSKLTKVCTNYQMHSLFALLSLSHAYVTNTERLMGVVALIEVHFLILISINLLLEVYCFNLEISHSTHLKSL